MGYRYFDSANIPVRYPFGYGLSYTEFAYSNLSVKDNRVTFTVTNTGSMDGAEIAQLYVSCEGSSIYRPKKELKGFSKVFLKAGESREVTIELDDKAFSYFDTLNNTWQVEDADYTICIAANVSDVRLTATVHIAGTTVNNPSPDCYKKASIGCVCDADFEKLLGHPIPDGKWGGQIGINDAFCQLYYAKSGVARLLYKVLTSLNRKAEAKGTPDLNIMFVYNMPLRAIAKMSMGMVSEKMTHDIVFMFNGHFFRGLGRLLVDFFKNLSRSSKFNKSLRK